jgi:hypothetical protein
MRTHLAPFCLVGLSLACATARRSAAPLAPTPLRVIFAAQTDSFQAAAREYDSLWTSDGARMTRALEIAARLRFADTGDTVIRALVFEGVSTSGYHDKPMQLRASYPLATKKATLMHELGHRLESDLFRASEDDHPFLFLWLSAAWVDAYGEEFAREQVAVERRRGGVYPAAWNAALALSAEGRAARWDSVRLSRMRQ